MMNLAYLRRQLTLAADCLKRGMDILDTESPARPEAPPGSCQCNDPTVICPVHPRGPTAAELLADAPPFNPDIGRDPPTREDLRKALAADGAAELREPPDPLKVQYEEARYVVDAFARGDASRRLLFDTLGRCGEIVLVELVVDLVELLSDDFDVEALAAERLVPTRCPHGHPPSACPTCARLDRLA